MDSKKVAVIGGGAAGFFAALSAKEHHPNHQITLFEKTPKVLSKVKISGGGRCNVTHNCPDISRLCEAYPRGGKKLRSLFHQFNTTDTVEWFENRGVPLKTEKDGRMFPVSDESQSIIDCLVSETVRLKIDLQLGQSVERIQQKGKNWKLEFKNLQSQSFNSIIITSGGSTKIKGFEWLRNLGHSIATPIPSLFTFNMPNEHIKNLMGLSVENARVKILNSKIQTQGPLLITHWGMSGPAILKASAFGARELSQCDYVFDIQINWVDETNINKIFDYLQHSNQQHPKKRVSYQKTFPLPNRLWGYLIDKAGISSDKKWNEVGKKKLRILANLLTQDQYAVSGKTIFKEEFVTCGGVVLNEINLKTMQSKKAANLYFAGEVLDIDAITGGFNFQAAWSGGYIAGKLN
tara:strand:- start:349 stop:1566 length:1218 start_codon:yes stop_codon:yes gene_type:complete